MSTSWPEPTMVERANDLGWMALSASSDPIRLGVVGDTEQEVRETFEQRRGWWGSKLWMPDPGPLRERQYGGAEYGGPV